MFCPKCRAVNADNSQFCAKCGQSFAKGAVVGSTPAAQGGVQPPLPPAQPVYNQSGLNCPKCGSHHVSVVPVTNVKTKHRGCIGWAIWILLAVCTLGLILIIPLLTNSKTKSKTHTEAVCQNCGNRWKVKK